MKIANRSWANRPRRPVFLQPQVRCENPGQFERARICIGYTGGNTEERVMTLDEKLAFAQLLRMWRSWFVNNWVTAEQVIGYLRHLDDRELLKQLGIADGDHDELNRR